MRGHRCVVPVDGFYEWLLDEKTGHRQPYFLCNQPPAAVLDKVPLGRPSVHVSDAAPFDAVDVDGVLYSGREEDEGVEADGDAHAAREVNRDSKPSTAEGTASASGGVRSRKGRKGGAGHQPLLLAGIYDVWRPST